MAGWAAAAQAAAEIGGALLDRHENRRAQERSENLQREFAQMGIRWRVADAQAAGVHPLFALGAQVPSASPVAIPSSMGESLSRAGQHVGRAMAAQQTEGERQMQALAMRKMEAEIAETDARRGLLESEKARMDQERNATPALPTNVGGYNPYGDVMPEGQAPSHGLQGQVTLKPAELPTTKRGDTSVVAGDPGLWRKFNMADGLGVYLPGGVTGDAAEVLESLAESPLMMYMVYQENVKRQGPEWGKEFAKRYFGGGPKEWLKEGVRYFSGKGADLRKKFDKSMERSWWRSRPGRGATGNW